MAGTLHRRMSGVAAAAAVLMGVLIAGQPHAHASGLTQSSPEPIVFAKHVDAGSLDNFEIFTINPDGSGLRQLTVMTGADVAPSWNGARSEIAWVHEDFGTDYGVIMVMNADGSSVRQVTAFQEDRDPSFSPNGRSIAFVRKVSGVDRILLVSRDGSGMRKLNKLTGATFDPAFSPDGSTIAFARRTADGTEIWIQRLDGSSPERVLRSTGALAQPDWSADGSRLAYRAGQAVFVKSLGSTGTRMVIDNAEAPSFSPDGRSIAVRMGPSIYTVGVDGSDLRLLTGSSNDVSIDPDWGFPGS